MAHNIFEDEIYVDMVNGPAWHGIGINNRTGLPVREVAALLEIPDVWLEPLVMAGQPSKWSVVMRNAPKSARKQHARSIGSPVLTGKFVLISHKDAVNMWAEKVVDDTGKPATVESMGMLGELGQKLFITCELPGFDAAGQEVKNYLVLINPVKPGIAIKALVTSTLVVCQNTMTYAEETATQSIIVRHTEGAHERVGDALGGIYGNALMSLDVIREACDILLKTPVTDAQAREVFEAVYPYPKMPDLRLVAQMPDSARMEKWTNAKAEIDFMRSHVAGLFAGGGIGLGDSRVSGTAWAAWQSVTEMETHRNGNADNFRVAELLDGSRAARIANAQKMLLALAGN